MRGMLGRWGALARGIGDDAAIVDVKAGERLIVSTDTAIENVHFRRSWLTPAEIGYRCVTAALSDLAAMAARPLGVIVGLVLPDGWIDAVPALADGIGEAVAAHETLILGGDITRGPALMASVTVLGAARTPARRDAVSPGDIVYVTGLLGGPATALRALQAGREPDPVHRARFAGPRARIREATALARQGATAMIDISDGLASELGHLAVASGVELRIDVARIPILRGCTLEDAARGGEEYELVVVAPHELDVDAFAREFALPLSEIGRARRAERPGVRASLDGTLVDLGAGHDHFSA